eukprot:sb/3469552/
MPSPNLTVIQREIQGEIHEGVGNQSEHLTDHQVESNDKESVEMYSGEDVVVLGVDKVPVLEYQSEEGKPEMGIVERRLQTLKKRLSGLLLLDSDSEGDTRPSHISEDAGEDAGSLDGRSIQDDMGGSFTTSNTGTFIEKEGNYSILMERLGVGEMPSPPPTPVNSITPPPPPPADFSCDPEITEALNAMRNSLKVCSHALSEHWPDPFSERARPVVRALACQACMGH